MCDVTAATRQKPTKHGVHYVMCYLFQRAFDLYTLSPRHGGISQAVPIVGLPGEFDSLFVQVAEGLRHHLHGVIGQR